MIDMLHQIFVVVEVISLKKNSKNNNIFFFFLESPSRAQWDDDDSDKRRSQWEYPTPSDRQGYRKRDTDYYNRYEYIIVEFLGNFLLCFFRKRNDTPLPTPSFRKSKHEEFDEDDQRNWEEEQKVEFFI